jgi:hypothetical protein
MANSVFYAAVLDQKPMPLKTRLGAIQPPGAVEAPIEAPIEAPVEPPVEDELR